MFGAHFFADPDFDKSKSIPNSQIFQEQEDIELPGNVLKLNSTSIMVYDIKKMCMQTGEMKDYGFAIQPLIHTLKQKDYLIGGRYQLPVYKGSLPAELLPDGKLDNHDVYYGENAAQKKPRTIFKNLIESGKIQQIENMQIVSQLSDLHPDEDTQA